MISAGCNNAYQQGYSDAMRDFRKEQEPKTGHWITQWNVAHQKEYYYCSECREEKCRYDLSEDCHNTDCLNCVLDKIRAEIHATAEMHEDGDYYLRDEWIDEIIDKYKAESENL